MISKSTGKDTFDVAVYFALIEPGEYSPESVIVIVPTVGVNVGVIVGVNVGVCVFVDVGVLV